MILVVGGAGYIGSHMVRMLRERGEQVLVLDNLSTGHADLISGARLIQADLTDFEAVRRVFATEPIEVVMHFAAASLVGESMQEPIRYWRNNVGALLNLMQAAQQHPIKGFVFSSSAAVYGQAAVQPISESAPMAPIHPYGQTKAACEQILASSDHAFGLRSVSLRYFNAAGAHESGEIGERHNPESHLIPAAMLSGMGKMGPLQIFGSDYPTPDGTCVRDYIHVQDLCEAHMLALKHLRGGGETLSLNIGTGTGYSVRQVVEQVQAVTGLRLEINEADRRPGDPPTLIADASAIQTRWGWKPERSDLPTLVADAWRFLRRDRLRA